MTDLVVAPGRAGDLVPVDAVDDLLAVVRAGLDDLRSQVERAERDADGAELRHRALVLAGSPDADRVGALRTALGQMAFASDDQQDASLVAAEAQATARVTAARAEAHEIVLQAQVERAHQLARPIGEPTPPAAPPAPPLQPAALVARPRPVAPPPSEPALTAGPTPATWPTAEIVPPSARAAVIPDDADETFVAFWQVEDRPERSAAGDGISTLLVGVVGALVAVTLLLLLIG